jgi:hypothetical protein
MTVMGWVPDADYSEFFGKPRTDSTEDFIGFLSFSSWGTDPSLPAQDDNRVEA